MGTTAPLTLAVGNSTAVVARPNTPGGDQAGDPLGALTWASSDATKATVTPIPGPTGQAQAATVLAKATGSVNITATRTSDGSTSVVAVTVVASDNAGGFYVETQPPFVG